jgi:hypothetical protein
MDTIFSSPSADQRKTFLAWFKWFYSNALVEAPQPGQALVLAGPPACGKTFMSTALLAKAVGGFGEGTAYLMGDTEFNGNVIEKPIMAVDDATPTTDPKLHARYTANLKAIVANNTVRYRTMYRPPAEVTWLGRPIITCNLDAMSMDVLPGLEASNRDKVILLKMKMPTVVFPSLLAERSALLDKELPYFLRWLLDWEYPEECVKPGSRYHVAEIQHGDLYRSALEASPGHEFMELLEDFIEEYRENMATRAERDVQRWTGNTNKLFTDIEAVEHMRPLIRNYRPRQVSRFLADFAEKEGYNIRRAPRTADSRGVWHIGFNLVERSDDLAEGTTPTEASTPLTLEDL